MPKCSGPTTESKPDVARDEILAIRQARRYLRDQTGVLARVLAAYRDADHCGDRIGYLPDQ